jgi:hypothetical protein
VNGLWGVHLLGITMAQLAIFAPAPAGHYVAI